MNSGWASAPAWALRVGLSAAALAIVISVAPGGWVPYAALLSPLLLLLLYSKRLQPVSQSPVWIVVITFVAIGVLGFAFRGRLADEGGGGVRLRTSEQLALETAFLFAGLATAIAVGSIVYSICRQSRGSRLKFRSPPAHVRTTCLFVCAALMAILILDLGSELLERPSHLVGSGDTNIINGLAQLGVGAVALLGYLSGAEKGTRRIWAIGLALGFFAIFLGLSSRRLSLFPILFAVGLSVAQVGRRRVFLLAGAVTSLALLPLPLYLRGQQQHGLEPYIASLGDFTYGDVDWLATANNILISFSISAHAAFVEPRIPASWLWIELNPLPGNLAGWREISPALGLNSSTPYSAIGELGNYGPWAVALCGMGLGVLLAYLDSRVRYYAENVSAFLSVAILGMSAFAAVTALQYSTRTAFRLILYVLAIDLVLRSYRYLTKGSTRQVGKGAVVLRLPSNGRGR